MKFSIITCSFNSLTGLKDVMARLKDQALADGDMVEHLVVDGGSTDGTAEWLETVQVNSSSTRSQSGNGSKGLNLNSKLELNWISEPDTGLYDALNKGMQMATGDVIGIWHTDDVWEEDVLKRVHDAFQTQLPVTRCPLPVEAETIQNVSRGARDPQLTTDNLPQGIYGDLLYVDADDITKIKRVWRSGPYQEKKWWNGWMPPHPALFVRREVAVKVGDYRLDLGSAADYEWMLRAALVHQVPLTYLSQTLVRMRTGGASNASVKGRLSAHGYDRHAWEVNGLKPYPWTLKMKVIRKIPQWFRRVPS